MILALIADKRTLYEGALAGATNREEILMKKTDSAWKPELFNWDGMYLTYGVRAYPMGPAFVARFKYGRKTSDMRHFRKFLEANFTPAEYFAAMNTPEQVGSWMQTPGPLTILQRKGYISPNMAKALEVDGFPATPEGKAARDAKRRADYSIGTHERLCSGSAN